MAGGSDAGGDVPGTRLWSSLMDVVVTLPKKFGLKAWIGEGDAAGDPPDPDGRGDGKQKYYYWTVSSCPKIEPGDRVYVVYAGRLIGYAPLLSVGVEVYTNRRGDVKKRWKLWRQGGAEAVTIDEHIFGFQGYRYRWWDRENEYPFPEWRELA